MILWDRNQIEQRGRAVAAQLAADHDTPPLLVGLMDGALPWLALLLREWPVVRCAPDYVTVKATSYEGNVRQGHRTEFEGLRRVRSQAEGTLSICRFDVDGVLW